MLRYTDARAALQWLKDAFGFVLVFSVPESGPYVRQAQLQLGSGIVMLGSVRPDEGLTFWNHRASRGAPSTYGPSPPFPDLPATPRDPPPAHRRRLRYARPWPRSVPSEDRLSAELSDTVSSVRFDVHRRAA